MQPPVLAYVFVAVVSVLLLGALWRLYRARTTQALPTQAAIDAAKGKLADWQGELNTLRDQAKAVRQHALGGKPVPPLPDDLLGDPEAEKKHDNAVAKRTRAQLLFTVGGFCLLIWPVLVALNCTVLGQVMELFVPPGAVPVVIPLVGWEMDPTALALAFIIALCQAVFVLFFGAMRGWSKAAAGVLMVAGVAFETGGAFMRAKILQDAGLGGGGMLAGQTAAVSALIGFVAPVAEMIASEMAVTKVIAPLIELPGIIVSKIALWLQTQFSAAAQTARVDLQAAQNRPLSPAQEAKKKREQEQIARKEAADKLKQAQAEKEAEAGRKGVLLLEVRDAQAKSGKLSDDTVELAKKVDGLDTAIGQLGTAITELEQSRAATIVKDPDKAMQHFDSALAEAKRERILDTPVPEAPNRQQLGEAYPERLQTVLETCEKLLQLLDDNVAQFLSKETDRTKRMLIPLRSVDSEESGILTWTKLNARRDLLQSAQKALKLDHGKYVQEHEAIINSLNQILRDRRLANGNGDNGQPASEASAAGALDDKDVEANRRMIGEIALRLGYGAMGQMAFANLQALQGDGDAQPNDAPRETVQAAGQGSVYRLLLDNGQKLDGSIQANIAGVGARLHGKVDAPRSCTREPNCTEDCPICERYRRKVENVYNDFVVLEVEPRRHAYEERHEQVRKAILQLESQSTAWRRFLARLRKLFGGGNEGGGDAGGAKGARGDGSGGGDDRGGDADGWVVKDR